MPDHIAMIRALYDCFNARDIDGALRSVNDDVAWANAMEGGHVYGPAGIRAYWTRQWAIVSPHVEPIGFDTTSASSIVVEVRQTLFDLEGKPQHTTLGLRGKNVRHAFTLRDDKVSRFDVLTDE